MTAIPPERRRQADRRQEAIGRILDAAEAAFAAHGYDGTTLNQIAKAVSVDTALLRYYFTDKEALFDAVLQRRSSTLNEARLRALDAYSSRTGNLKTLEGVIDVFVRSTFQQMMEDEGSRNYAAIIAYLNSSRSAQRYMSANFDEASQRFIATIREIFPTTPEAEVFWAFHFFSGTFTFSIGQTGRIDHLSGGLVSAFDFPAIADRLIIAGAAQIRAICTRDLLQTAQVDEAPAASPRSVGAQVRRRRRTSLKGFGGRNRPAG